MPNAAAPQLLIVPGAFTGAWMWTDVVDGLAADGFTATVVELPTVGENTTDRTFNDDVAAVRAALDASAEPVILVGHSYGGAVITAAAAGPHPSVKELVYVAGAAPGSGESMATATAAAAERAGRIEREA
ncbi:MAG: alpha/beta fold hydrolase, partial [Solirubrobacteraceae bacterium]|nr:alpha/beta fold hydrolase [Solirubrobacteraceae bacterium]